MPAVAPKIASIKARTAQSQRVGIVIERLAASEATKPALKDKMGTMKTAIVAVEGMTVRDLLKAGKLKLGPKKKSD